MSQLPTAAVPPPPDEVIYDTRTGQTLTEAQMLDRLAQADAVFVGEQHDDAATHRLERRLLEGLSERVWARLSLGMEMFERDVQPVLDDYLAGRINEAAFRKACRPWSNYATDYRPLVEYAKAHRVPVIASNAPQSVVGAVAREGLGALRDAPPGQVATLVQTPQDAYWDRFRQTMQAMGGAHGGTMDDATIQRFYEAQVVRDETMAASVARALAATPQGVVLHVNGRFHSDFGEGVPQRLLWRRPLTRVCVVSAVPVTDLPTAVSPDDRALGDFVVYLRVQ